MMKLYKCIVRKTETSDGVLFMQAPNVDLAKDSMWVDHAETFGDLFDDFHGWKSSYEVLDVKEVQEIGDVPEGWRDQLPWYHPKHEPSQDVEIRKLLDPGLEDTGKWVFDMLATLEKQKEEIQKKMESLQKFTSTTI